MNADVGGLSSNAETYPTLHVCMLSIDAILTDAGIELDCQTSVLALLEQDVFSGAARCQGEQDVSGE